MTDLKRQLILPLVAAALLPACGGGGGGGGGTTTTPPPTNPPPPPPSGNVDDDLRALITDNGLTGDPTTGRSLPDIDEPLAQLGKLLFFSKSLSGDLDVACASCHHPALGGADGLALPVGVGALDPDVVGPGRARADGLPNVGRHSQSVFNVGLLDAGLFWDSRVESIGKEAGRNGAGSEIRTPESALNSGDPAAGPNLVAAQARMPVVVDTEMRGSLMPGASADAVRDHLAARIGDYGSGQGELVPNNWLGEFQAAFASAEPAETLVTFDNIALAIGEYQRSMVFVDTPWKAYVDGDDAAISTEAKEGAVLFLGSTDDQRLACSKCHSGDAFTDEEHHTIAFPQIGPGKGDRAAGDGDFGREQQTADAAHRFRFRTPSLLNATVTGPYTHTGAYAEVDDTLAHYFVPRDTIEDFFSEGICNITQFSNVNGCSSLFPNARDYTLEALTKVNDDRIVAPDFTFPDLSFSSVEDMRRIEAFIETLTDPCTTDRACLAPWIPDVSEAPDANQLNAVNANGDPL